MDIHLDSPELTAARRFLSGEVICISSTPPEITFTIIKKPEGKKIGLDDFGCDSFEYLRTLPGVETNRLARLVYLRVENQREPSFRRSAASRLALIR